MGTDTDARDARTAARRARLAAIPHKQASEIRTVEVPARPGVMAHKDFLVTTACGQEMPTTLVTRTDDRVRCPECKATVVPVPGTDEEDREQ